MAKNCSIQVDQKHGVYIASTLYEMEDYRVATAIENLLSNIRGVKIQHSPVIIRENKHRIKTLYVKGAIDKELANCEEGFRNALIKEQVAKSMASQILSDITISFDEVHDVQYYTATLDIVEKQEDNND